MKTCSIYNNSLRFSRAAYGALVLIAFFLRNQWLILAVSLLMGLSAISMKLNLTYQIHVFFSEKIRKKKMATIQKESGEINFVSGMTALLLLGGFLWIYFSPLSDLAWIYILVVDSLIFLACFAGFCVATLMYVFFKKVFYGGKKSASDQR